MGGYASPGDSVPGDSVPGDSVPGDSVPGDSVPGGGSPSGVPEDDFDLDAHIEWVIAEIDAGRQQVPPASAGEGPAVAVSRGAACDVAPELLAGMCGAEGLGGEALSAAFGQDEAADVLRPGPVLAALTAQVIADPAALTDDELVGALQAARRLANHAAYQQTGV